jgi:hypothetical protein
MQHLQDMRSLVARPLHTATGPPLAGLDSSSRVSEVASNLSPKPFCEALLCQGVLGLSQQHQDHLGRGGRPFLFWALRTVGEKDRGGI